jgi:cation diffusion facilitator CzcD-associated flavoprotein CzcO
VTAGSARSVAVVGGGLGGCRCGGSCCIALAYDDVTVFERGERVGGVWHHTTYPGAACDVPSHLYEFSFAPKPRVVAPLRDPAGDPGVCGRSRPPLMACWTASAPHRGAERQLGRRSVGRWLIKTTLGDHQADVLITPADSGRLRLRLPLMTRSQGEGGRYVGGGLLGENEQAAGLSRA